MFHMQQAQQTKKPGRSIEQVVGEQIASMRATRDMTQRSFAAALTDAGMPVDASAVSRIEKGTRSVRLAEAVIIADVLDVDLGFLMRGVLTPEMELKEIRVYTETSRRQAVRPVVDFLNGLTEAKQFLKENEGLLAMLGDDGPASADEYVPWVAGRIDRLPVEDFDELCLVESAEDREQLLDLVNRWASKLIVLESDEVDAPVTEYAKAPLVKEIRDGLSRSEYDRRRASASNRRQSDKGRARGEHSEEA